MSDPDYEQLEQRILELSEEQQKRLIRRLREKVGLHPLEVTWNTDAETILNAIERGSDLTKRGIRGILAEASLGTHVIEQLEGWRDLEIKGDAPYDYLIEDGVGRVRIQVKNQRRERGKPKTGGNKYGHDMYMVETQKTRSGKSSEGKKTRPTGSETSTSWPCRFIPLQATGQILYSQSPTGSFQMRATRVVSRPFNPCRPTLTTCGRTSFFR